MDYVAMAFVYALMDLVVLHALFDCAVQAIAMAMARALVAAVSVSLVSMVATVHFVSLLQLLELLTLHIF
jgi:hypothetical protein